MSTETPIACSLGAAGLPQRLAQMGSIGRDALLSVSPEGLMRFRNDETTRGRLEAIIAAESQCCSFLRFDLAERSGELVLSISAPEAAEPLARDIVDAFAAEAKAA
jgi:hypothetical protein